MIVSLFYNKVRRVHGNNVHTCFNHQGHHLFLLIFYLGDNGTLRGLLEKYPTVFFYANT